MAERTVLLDEDVASQDQAGALEEANRRAERAEAELRKLKGEPAAETTSERATGEESAPEESAPSTGGEEELRRDSMMAHLLDSLAAGKDIGHYGRLVFAMVARHFMPHDEVLAWMKKDKDVDEEKARLLLRQVEGRDYNPPRRDKILAYQEQQDFPILPDPHDPDCGNLYRNLKFPNHIYEHIEEYREAKLESEG